MSENLSTSELNVITGRDWPTAQPSVGGVGNPHRESDASKAARDHGGRWQDFISGRDFFGKSKPAAGVKQ